MTGRAPAATPGSSEPPASPARDPLSYDGVLLRRLLAGDAGLSGIAIAETPHLIRLVLPPDGDPARYGALAQFLGRLDNRVDVVVHVTPAAGGAAAASWRDGVLQALQIAASLRREGDFQPITCMSLAGASELAATGDAANTGAATAGGPATAGGAMAGAAEILIHDTAPPDTATPPVTDSASPPTAAGTERAG
jgi:hypothetical protein